MTVRDYIKQYGLEALKGLPSVVDGETLFIHENSLNAAIELWRDEPEKAHLHRRFYGGTTPNVTMCKWIYASNTVRLNNV